MAVLSGATASGKQFYGGALTTTGGTNLYTSPAQSANVTTPSATAYVKEIVLCNVTGSSATATIQLNGVSIVSGVTVNANDTKIISGLNTMIPAGQSLTGSASAASSIHCLISGVEVQ